MGNGLNITEEQFMSMSSKERDLTVFKNMVHIRKQFCDYKLTKKIQYVWLSALTLLNGTYLGFRGWFT